MTDISAEPAKRSLILKFEYDGQQYELSSLTTADTVGDLRAVVCSMLNIDEFRKINLKTLQPTKILNISDDTKPLSEIFGQTRERIVVEDNQAIAERFGENSRLDSSKHGSTSRIPSRPSIKHHKSSTIESEEQPSKADTSNQEAFSSNSLDQSYLHQQNSSATNESPARQRKLPRDQSEYPVCSSTGYLLRHPVPSNNSCLFISVHFCLTNGVVDDQIGKSMRKIIADTVASDKRRFDDAFLGKSNADYCNWILDDNNWGGAIELSILCKYYETEIVAIDVKNTLLNRFGEDSHYPQRMLLLYDGLHYDPLMFQPLDDHQSIQTLFSTDNIEVLTLAEELAKEAKQSHQFTDMKTITMQCAVCNAELDAKTAPEHAAETGHVDFIEK